MQLIEGIIGVTSVLSILFFAIYLVGLLRTPTGHRPKTTRYNRYGELLPPSENPGYQETEDESHRR